VRDLLQLYRDSPTLAFPMSIRLSDEISWLSIKDYSNKSFPADHATTALLFATTYAFFSRGALRWSAIGYGIFLCLPRLFAGAHWFSDIAAGSGSILLCFFGLVFHTPLQAKCSRGIEALLGRLFFLKKREAEEA
jgi:Kdo2-lipid A phosphotransferase